jgi:hypothetical protein
VGKVSLHTETAMRIAEIMLGYIVFSTEKVDERVVMVREKNSRRALNSD